MNKIQEFIQNNKEAGRIEIPDVVRNDLPEFFKSMGYTAGVEIGVYKGYFSKTIAESGLILYSIDPWKAYGDYADGDRFQDRQDYLYRNALHRLSPYPNCTIIRSTSMNALNRFADESLDFVYIDGHHGFKFVAEDIWEWSKKVRQGGIISGHDYGLAGKPPDDPYTLHVKYVVDAYTAACGIKTWYVLGRKNAPEGEKRDNWRSWFWFKQ
jgi:hypothetical protein